MSGPQRDRLNERLSEMQGRIAIYCDPSRPDDLANEQVAGAVNDALDRIEAGDYDIISDDALADHEREAFVLPLR